MSKLAVVPSATVLGVEGRPVRVEVHVSPGLPALRRRRPARRRLPRGPRPGAGRGHHQRRTVAGPAHHGEPRAVVAAQGGQRPRPRHRRRRPRGRRARSPLEKVAGMGFVGELGLDGAVRPVAGTVPLVDALDTDIAVVPGGERRRGAAGRPARRAAGGDPARADRRARGRGALARPPGAAAQRRGPARGRPGRRARASRWPATPSSSPPPAATTCCSSDRPAPGKTMLAQRLPGHPAAALGGRGAARHARPLGGRRRASRPAG